MESHWRPGPGASTQPPPRSPRRAAPTLLPRRTRPVAASDSGVQAATASLRRSHLLRLCTRNEFRLCCDAGPNAAAMPLVLMNPYASTRKVGLCRLQRDPARRSAIREAQRDLLGKIFIFRTDILARPAQPGSERDHVQGKGNLLRKFRRGI